MQILCDILSTTVLPAQTSYCTVLYYVLGANRQNYVLVHALSKKTLPTRKFSEEITTCTWLTISYEACYCTSLLNKICMLVPNVTVSWRIKDAMLFILYIL